MSLLKRITTTFFALLFAVFSINLTGVMTLQNAYATDGNNGTFKVQEKGSSPTNANDPKVCTFRFVADNLDDHQTGNVTVEGHGSTPAGTYLTLPISTNGNGDGNTVYVNDGGAPTLANGHYKATLDNKFGTDPGNKAKSKTFKVDCPETVTPTAPTESDECGTEDDSYTIPTTTGVKYQKKTITYFGWDVFHLFPQVSWVNINAGTHDGSGTVDLRAVVTDDDDYVLSGTSTWTLTFSNEECDIEIPTVAAPTPNDECSTENDSYIIPALATGIEKYQVNLNGGGWQDTTPGEHDFTATGEVKIRAVAANGYSITGTSEWTFNFDNDQCPVFVQPATPTHVDECGTADDKLFIPSGMDSGYKYQVDGQDIAAGEHPGSGSVTVTAVPLYDYINLTGPTQWLFEFTNITCVAPAEPTLIDKCGDNKDKFVIPSTEGVVYKVDGQVVVAGDHFTDSDVVVTAHALNANYELVGQTEWTLDFSQDLCPAVATEPTMYDICGTHADYYTIPSIEGVRYKVSNTGNPGTFLTVDDGNHWNAGEFYVKAVAKNGYELTGLSEWTLYLDQSKCKVYANVDHTDECASENDSYTIPTTEHVTYEKLTIVGWVWIIPILDWVEVPAGDYDGEGIVLIRAVADQGYKVKGQDTWLLFFSGSKCEIELEAEPFAVDMCGTEDDGIYITGAEGVTFTLNGNPANADMFHPATGTVTVVASATDEDYEVAPQSEWTFELTDVMCPPCLEEEEVEIGQDLRLLNIYNDEYPQEEVICYTDEVTGNDPAVDICDITADTFEVIARTGVGYEVSVNGGPATPILPGVHKVTDWAGDYSNSTANIVITGYALPGYTYVGQTTWNYTFTDAVCTPGRGNTTPPVVTPTGIELPQTAGKGANPIVAIATILLSALAAYGATFYLVNRRELATKK